MGAVVKREAMLSLYETPLYDDAAVRELFMAVGRPSGAASNEHGALLVGAVAFELSEMGKRFAFALFHEGQASNPKKEKEAKRLAAALAKVLDICGVQDGGPLLPMFAEGGLFAAAAIRGEPKGEAAIMNALHAVDLLRQDALKMAEVMGKRRAMKAPKVGHPGNEAMRALVRDLSCLYESVWDRSPGVSNGDDEPDGPLMRLMLDVTKRLRDRGLPFSATKDGLRQVWRKIDRAEKMPTAALVEQARAAGWFNA